MRTLHAPPRTARYRWRRCPNATSPCDRPASHFVLESVPGISATVLYPGIRGPALHGDVTSIFTFRRPEHANDAVVVSFASTIWAGIRRVLVHKQFFVAGRRDQTDVGHRFAASGLLHKDRPASPRGSDPQHGRASSCGNEFSHIKLCRRALLRSHAKTLRDLAPPEPAHRRAPVNFSRRGAYQRLETRLYFAHRSS